MTPWSNSAKSKRCARFAQRDDVSRVAPWRALSNQAEADRAFVESVDIFTARFAMYLSCDNIGGEGLIVAAGSYRSADGLGDRFRTAGAAYEGTPGKLEYQMMTDRYAIRLGVVAISYSASSARPLTRELLFRSPRS